MNEPKRIRISDFSYDLPEDRIAQHPLPDRDASRLLVCRDGIITERVFRDIAAELPAEMLLVFNDTRVIRARLEFFRSTGGRIEIFCTEPDTPADVQQLMQQEESCTVKCLVGNLKKWKAGEVLEKKIFVAGSEILLRAERAGEAGELQRIRFSWSPGTVSFSQIVEACGLLPLPPYMNREASAEDDERYQTIYAQHNGSVAAPTAGLHFTEHVLEELRRKNIHTAQVTLHVGAGTFRPVKSETMSGHDMHREEVSVSHALVKKLAEARGGTVCAVGTTALRTLESLYWFGKKLVLFPGKHLGEMQVGQWEPYEQNADVPVPVALRALHDWMTENNKETLTGSTSLLIAPGYDFKIVHALITNFHQPQSTLLLLVAAFAGNRYRDIYDYALAREFRFLSYGDSSLLFR
ncbi:MAG: S-adenosylmethionine:tRNA ribosyltransferase-isomerase [Bacteroidetes bacterium]|nr:MAG: S-adenosylmethionine:tRNA ribosyltransferase-isomerase [Bacteroidota bacterium]